MRRTSHIRDHNNDRYKDNGGFRGDINYAMFLLSQGVGQQGFPEESESEVTPILYDPMNCILPGSSIHGIFQARILERVAGLPFPSPGDLPNPGIEPGSPALQADSTI